MCLAVPRGRHGREEGAMHDLRRSSGSGGRLWLAAVALALVATAPRDARAENYKDAKLGFSLTTPSKWNRMPISTDERWLVAEWQCQQKFEWSDAKTNSWTYHQPKLDVVIIPYTAADQKGAEVTKVGDKVVVKQQAPWKDMKEYLDKTLQKSGPGGFYFSKEEPLKVGTMDVVYYEVTMDKFTSTYDNAPRKFYAWEFHAEDAIYGLVGEALVRWEEKIRPDIETAFKTFKIFPRTGTLPGAESTPGDDGDVIVTEDQSKKHLTDDQLRKERNDLFSQRLARIKDTLPKDWKVKESENFTAVSHCDDKFTKEILDHAEALRAWLEQALGYVGTGHAGKIIIRVCATDDEESAMAKSMSWSVRPVEVLTSMDRNGWYENKLSSLNSGIYRIWFGDKNRDLLWRLPPWINSGLSACVRTAVSKGRKITDFKSSTWDNVEMANLRRSNKLMEAKRFFTMDWEAMWTDFENHRQSEYFVRYLLVGSAQRNSKYKNLLGDYLKNLAIYVDEAKQAAADEAAKAKDGDPAKPKEPQNEQEEAELQRKANESWKSYQKELLQKLIEKTFPKWEDKDWTQFNNSYWKELGA
jgi:hypothetical protein